MKGKYIPTANSFFSGGGLLDVGLQQAGVKVVQSNDIDKDAIACMKANKKYFNHIINTTSITDQLVLDQPQADAAFFTYPCTKYSAIADIHSARTGDELFLHAFRHWAIKQYEFVAIENVPGMKAFPVVMEAMTKLPGYHYQIFCPVDAALWLPQKRERLIIFATKKRFNISAPKSNRRIRLKDIIERNPVVDMPEYVISRIKGAYRDKPIIVDPANADAIAPTCVAHYAKDLGTRLVVDKKAKHGLRPFSIREYGRLQGLPDDYILPNARSSYKIIGNGVAVHVGEWMGKVTMKYFN
jgi:DNA (cytosine-5)-methyltransferase 1